jgi:carbamoyl-phosphate synthase large subunit
MFSCEKDESFCAISHLAKILSGPKFASDEFQTWLKDTIEKYNIDIVIPNMDSATVALSRFNETVKTKARCVVSSFELCEIMNDKILSENFFHAHDLPTFENTPNFYPKIAKDRFGFGAHGQYIFNTESEMEHFFETNDRNRFLVQDFRPGVETSVDFYVDGNKRLLGYVLRNREEVSDGEVMNCTTHYPDDTEKKLIENVAAISGRYGCITLQYIRDKNGDIRIVEINPRFGGGATCAIECGLDMPTYILDEYAGLEYSVGKIKNVKMVRARRDFFHDI